MFRHPGFPLGRLFGIPVTINPSWLIILGIFSLSFGSGLRETLGVAPIPAYAIGAVTALVAFITLLAHEFGHALAARWFGIETERITLFLLGGVAQIRSEPRRPIEELVIAIAGPVVSIFCMVLFGAVALTLHLAGAGPVWVFPFQTLAIINAVFAVFNMIPGFPMDGGRVLRALVWMVTGRYLLATRVAATAGRVFGFGLAGFGLLLLLSGSMHGLMPTVMGFFLAWLAKTSLRQATYKDAFDRVRVADVMRPVQVVVPATTPLRHVVDDYIHRVHADRFPVVRGGALLGYIAAEDIHGTDRRLWETTPAERLARPFRRSEVLSPLTDAQTAYSELARLGRPSLPVFDGSRLIGYLFARDLEKRLGLG